MRSIGGSSASCFRRLFPISEVHMPVARIVRSSGALCFLLIAIACTAKDRAPAGDTARTAAFDSAAVRRAIDSAEARMDSAVVRQDMAGLTEVLAEDYVSLEAPGQITLGRAAYRAGLDSMAKAGRWQALEYRADGFDVSGDLAVKYGRFSMTYVPTGKDVVSDSGNFIHVWRRQADGSWRLARDISNFVPRRRSPPATGANR